MSKNEIEGQRDNKRIPNVNHGWPNDKKTWFEHIPEGLKSNLLYLITD